MNIVSQLTGNYYTCTKCGGQVVTNSSEPELNNFKHTCGTEPVKMKLGKHKIEKPALQYVVEAPQVKIEVKETRPPAPVKFNPSAPTAATVTANTQPNK